MSTSQNRIDANRANATRSTGPQTPEGKARSAQNARTGLAPAVVEKVRNIVTLFTGNRGCAGASGRFQLEGAPAHRRPQGIWSLAVTRNWRLTFRVDDAEGEISDLNYEDYH